ncbi:MAG: hypothetical protein IJ197_11475 [Bacteroidaceae bacterium]|nr:hypothetical protein [Bacteroidaceae bacterium]
MKRNILLILLVWPLMMVAQTPLDKPALNTATLVSPEYFGPNAFPVPEVMDGRVEGDLRMEVAGDYFNGRHGGHTTDISLRVNIPLWTRRANLSVWMPVTEWWRNTEANLRRCHVEEENLAGAKKGHVPGDVYVSVDMHLLTERGWRPDWVVRAALKTASSNYFYWARYYDSPGYFFDTSVAKSWDVGHSKQWGHNVRLALSTGFLCWQTDNGRQDDAVQYGVMVKWENRYFDLAQSLAGYSGWEHSASHGGELAHDRPAVLRTDVAFHVKKFDIVSSYVYGLRDYPYHQVRLGLAYRLNILRK